MDIIKLEQYVTEKLISKQRHASADLYIYNYTQKAQFDRIWNEETMNCRGLIMDGNHKVIARPFPKFFNYGEYKGTIPSSDFEITEKMDGSLGILYWLGSEPFIATRGSFQSEQAIKGTSMLQNMYADNSALVFDPQYTYLFEIIYPQNRIVVDYKGIEDLVLLAMVDTTTGKELEYSELVQRHAKDFTIVKKYQGIRDIAKLSTLEEPNKEGFVIHYENGLRLKVKFAEYVRLHRLVTGLNARHIWENLMKGKGIDELIDHVPDEFFKWVRDTANHIRGVFDGIESHSKMVYENALKFETRKEQALYIRTATKASSIVFMMLDKKDYKQGIWKMIRPAHEKPFRKEI